LRTAARAPSLASKFEDGKTDGLQTLIQARLAKLGVSKTTDEDLKELRKLNVRVESATQNLEVLLIEVQGTIGYQFALCSEVYAQAVDTGQKNLPKPEFVETFPPQRRETVRLKFQALADQCRALDKLNAERDALLFENGLIKKLSNEVDKIRGQIAAYRNQEAIAKASLEKAIAEFQASGAEAAPKPGKSKLQSLEQRAELLRSAVKAIAEANSAGAHVIAEDKLKSLETVLGAVAGSSDETNVVLKPDEQAAVAIIRDFPLLADEADKLLNEAKKPRVVPYLAAIDYQKLVVQSLKESERVKDKQAAALLKQLEAAKSEARALARVLDPLQKHPTWAAQSITQLDKSLSAEDKRTLYQALATYADEVQQFRIEAAVWGARAQAAEYEEGLVRSKFAAAEWDKLNETMAAVLADYHAAGIKHADLAEFFKALGLVAIGIGVAQ
jgi:hypothetical protein